MRRFRTLLATFRPSFLVLTPVCVSQGAATAYWAQGRLDIAAVALVLLGALAAHISVNTLNEYFDFKSGLDLNTRRTPFSGGSGALPAHPQAAQLVLMTAVAASIITAGVGLYFVRRAGAGLIPLGLIGLGLIYTYTQWINRNPWLCLIAPGTGFGLLMVMGTHYVLAGSYSSASLAAALPGFFLVNNLLLLNQFPDVDADRRAGRRHLPIVLGRPRSALMLGGFYLAAYGSLIVAVFAGALPAMTLLALATVPLAVVVYGGVRRHADDIAGLMPYLGRNVLVTLLTPLLIAVGVLL